MEEPDSTNKTAKEFEYIFTPSEIAEQELDHKTAQLMEIILDLKQLANEQGVMLDQIEKHTNIPPSTHSKEKDATPAVSKLLVPLNFKYKPEENSVTFENATNYRTILERCNVKYIISPENNNLIVYFDKKSLQILAEQPYKETYPLLNAVKYAQDKLYICINLYSLVYSPEEKLVKVKSTKPSMFKNELRALFKEIEKIPKLPKGTVVYTKSMLVLAISIRHRLEELPYKSVSSFINAVKIFWETEQLLRNLQWYQSTPDHKANASIADSPRTPLLAAQHPSNISADSNVQKLKSLYFEVLTSAMKIAGSQHLTSETFLTAINEHLGLNEHHITKEEVEEVFASEIKPASYK